MGKFFSKRKGVEVTHIQPLQPVKPEDPGLQRIRRNFDQDLEKFLLNNMLLSVQFFEHFEREVNTLRDNPVSEGDADLNKALAEHQRYCISPDRLFEVVRRHVLFRPAHGEGSRSYELLHSPRLMVVQDNVEVGEPRDEAVYATVTDTPNYRFIMEPTTNNRPGYVKLRAEECMLPHKRRETYETIKDRDEGVYTLSPSDTPNETDSARSTIQEQVVESDKNSPSPETGDLTETESAANGPPFHVVQSTVTDSTQTQKRDATKRVFGPQHPNCDPNKMAFTSTERRLSGIMHMRVDPPTFQKNRSRLQAARSTPNLAATDSPKNSGSSGYKSEGGYPDDANSEYGYTTITELTTPRPLKEHRLGHTPQNTSEIPEQCFNEIEVKFHDDEEERGNMMRKKKLFETRYYLNSVLFMRSFADIFVENIGPSLGLTNALNSATAQGTKIYCNVTQTHYDSKPIKIRHEIIPTIFSATWPEEALQQETRKGGIKEGSVPAVQISWPTLAMINQMKNYGCYLLPLGYMPTRGRNNEQCLEWQLAFPEAERYLETHLTHAQVRCLLFSMALYKTFLEPLNTQLGLLPIHIQTVLFWQCERNYASWPEDRPGEILLKFLDKLYDAIKKKHLEDYFINKRNLFESTPRTHLLKVQEKLMRIRENLVMHVLLALRNLRYTDTAFYPVLDCKKLYSIIISHENLTPNPQLQQPMINTITPKNTQSKQQSEEEESDVDEIISNTDLWKEVKGNDKEKKWKQNVRTQIMRERAAQQSKTKARAPAIRQRKLSTDSIDIKQQPNKSADMEKKTALLDFFIPHFIEMAHKSIHFKATQQARFYRQHAERLQKLLRECADWRKEEEYFSRQFEELYDEMDKESRAQRFAPEKLKPSALTETSTKREKGTSVHFLKSTQSQDHIFNKPNPFRKKTDPPHSSLPSTKTCGEQSQPNTNIVTQAQVYGRSTSRKTHTLPIVSTSQESRNDVTDSPHPSRTVPLTYDIIVESNESTDT